MSASRRHYDEEFKRRAVKLSYSSERTLTEISESLGISAGLLGKWRRKYTPSGEKTELSQALFLLYRQSSHETTQSLFQSLQT